MPLTSSDKPSSLTALTSHGNTFSAKFSLDITLTFESGDRQLFSLPINLTKKKPTSQINDLLSSGIARLEELTQQLYNYSFFSPMLMPGSHFYSSSS